MAASCRLTTCPARRGAREVSHITLDAKMSTSTELSTTAAAAATAAAARAVEKTAIGTRATTAAARDAEKTAAGAAVAGAGDSRGGNASAGGSSSGCINEEVTVSRATKLVPSRFPAATAAASITATAGRSPPRPF